VVEAGQRNADSAFVWQRACTSRNPHGGMVVFVGLEEGRE
jgi:hypothetical protein